jgi:hypothetical protein
MTPPSQPQLPSMPAPPPQQSFPPPPQFQAPPPPAYANVPPAQAPSGGHRGLYMVLGSLVTIAILVGAALYVPKLLKTHAGGEPTRTAEKPVDQKPPDQQKPIARNPEPPPAEKPISKPEQPKQVAKVTPPEPEHRQPTPQRITPAPRPDPIAPTPAPVRADPQPQRARLAQEPPQQPYSPGPGGGMPQPGGPTAPSGNTGNGELQELEHQHDLMVPRIEAVNTSLAKLQQEQSRMGLGLSPELIARQRRMQFYMETASGALRRGNVPEARTSLNNAERELDKLEERFGR